MTKNVCQLGCEQSWRNCLPGLFANGAQAAMMVRAPFERPDPPIPAMALPTINIFEDLATPHKRDPSSKSPRKKRKVYYNV